MNATRGIGIGAAATAVLIGCGQLMASPTLAPAPAQEELHNVTYQVRVDGVAPGSQATFRLNDNETNTASLSSLPGQVFEAHTVLLNPGRAGVQVTLRWPYSAKVHCEIEVDEAVTTQVDQFVAPKLGNSEPGSGVLSCGAPLTDTAGGAGASGVTGVTGAN